MMALIASEWERLWNRKITWFLFAMIPVILFVSGQYYQKSNQGLTPENPAYAVLDNFPVLVLAEQLMIGFNLMLLLLLVFSVTEEYRTGQIRMVMIRSYSFSQLLFAKWLTVMEVMLLFHVTYLILSYGFGAWMFDSTSQLLLFYHDEPVSHGPAFFYVLRYYALAFVTLIAISSIMTFIAVISQSTTTAIGGTIGFLLVSAGYPTILQKFAQTMEPRPDPHWYFLSITQIQYEGIALALAPHSRFVLFNTGVLFAYAFIFGVAAHLIFTKKDRFI
ncbi:ABC transporter permease [Melghirimyces algeriensis]|nr:ABC transporter permease [Melghirimyces algeriensis]